MTDTTWTQPTAKELLAQVRRIVAEHPSRHMQTTWMAGLFGAVNNLTVDEARAYALTDLPEEPADPERPVCGTTACVAGWLAILGSEPGTVIDSMTVRLPSGSRSNIWNEAQRLAGLSDEQQSWLFSGFRTRTEVLDGLDALIEDPKADLAALYRVTKTVTVTVTDSDGSEMLSRVVEMIGDRRYGEENLVLRAIREVYYEL